MHAGHPCPYLVNVWLNCAKSLDIRCIPLFAREARVRLNYVMLKTVLWDKNWPSNEQNTTCPYLVDIRCIPLFARISTYLDIRTWH